MLLMLCDPLGHYSVTILPLFFLCIITGIMSLDIPNPPLNREATSSPCCHGSMQGGTVGECVCVAYESKLSYEERRRKKGKKSLRETSYK